MFHISSGEVGDAHDHGTGSTCQRTFGRGDPTGEHVRVIAARWYQGGAGPNKNEDDEPNCGKSNPLPIGAFTNCVRARMAMLWWSPWRNVVLAAQTEQPSKCRKLDKTRDVSH